MAIYKNRGAIFIDDTAIFYLTGLSLLIPFSNPHRNEPLLWHANLHLSSLIPHLLFYHHPCPAVLVLNDTVLNAA